MNCLFCLLHKAPFNLSKVYARVHKQETEAELEQMLARHSQICLQEGIDNLQDESDDDLEEVLLIGPRKVRQRCRFIDDEVEEGTCELLIRVNSIMR